MFTRAALAAGAMLLCLSGEASAVTLVDPPLEGTVVEDFTQPYVFDGMGGNPGDPAPGEEPFVIPNAEDDHDTVPADLLD
jgi:hypothetical protein